VETPMTYAITLLARGVAYLLRRRREKPGPERPPGAPAPRPEEPGWSRGGSLYRYRGTATTVSVVLPSLYTERAAEEAPGREGVNIYMTWADIASPGFAKTVTDMVRAARGGGGARRGTA
jgi:hypothetical protein